MAQLDPHGSPRTRRGEDRRREILRAAQAVFSDKGYEQSSMAEIAAKVGVVEGALYKHFTGKRELLFEATRAHLEPRFKETKEQLGGIQGIRNRLRFVVWRHLREFVEEPGMCRLIIQEIRPYGDYQGSLLRDLIRSNTTLLAGVLGEAERAGKLRAGVQPAVVRDLVYGGIEHLAFRTLAGRGAIDADAIADQVTDLVLGGVGGEQSEPAADPESRRLRAQIDRLEALVDALRSTGGARS